MNGLSLFSWQWAAVAALALILTQVMVRRGSHPLLTVLLRAGVAVVTVVAVIAVADLVEGWRSDAERRALQVRANDIAARALLPGSPLACLDGQAGEAVETACEKAVFARPETAAAAVAYTEARLTLLADSLALAGGDDVFDTLIAGLRRSIELDRYGLAAQVLATRDGCTAEQCPAFALVEESGTLKANLKARAYDTYVARYATAWNKGDAAPAVAEGAKDAKPEVQPQSPSSPVSSRYDFPSAASIPPVSIMNAEPPRAQTEPSRAQAEPPAEASDAEAPLPPRRPAQTQGATTR